jgi:hypothetical protein
MAITVHGRYLPHDDPDAGAPTQPGATILGSPFISRPTNHVVDATHDFKE